MEAAMEHEEARTLVAAHATRHRASVELAGRIEDELAAASASPQSRDSRFWRRAGVGAFATAALAVALSIGVMSVQPTHDELLADEAVANHVRALQGNHVVDVASSDQHTVKPWFNGKIDYAAPVRDLAAEGFALVGGRLDYFDRREVAALVYRHKLHTINVLVMPAAGGTVAARTFQRQGFAVEHWTRDGMAYWAVSDADATTVAQLASLLGAEVAAR
jgi:anti-sigma factor RsiW